MEFNMDKMKLESADITAQNIEKIAELFPNCITETKDGNGNLKKAINFELLKQDLSKDIVDGKECYEFTWVGKKEAIIEANRPIRKTLRPCKEESVNWDSTENLYIEGDNLEALKLLQESYLGKVKMIYIDPPYNTGNDFIYNDDFEMSKEEYENASGNLDELGNRLVKNTDANGRFHSDWCSMIYPRLMVARNLLSDDGAIFISIDDNEVDNIKKICDEIFGRENFRNQILTRRRIKSLNLQFADNGLKSFNVGFEYILVYSKTEQFLFNPIRTTKQISKEKGKWNVFWSNADRPSMRYDILGFTPQTGQWRWQKELSYQAVENYKKYVSEYSKEMSLEEYWSKTGKNLRFVRRIDNGEGKNGGVQYWVGPSDSSLRTSNWTDIEVSQIAKDYDLPFDNPKNVNLIETIISSVKNKDFIALDFFAGSSTTADAIFRQNIKDNGERKFIMIQIPQKIENCTFSNISEIGIERIRQAAKKIAEDNPNAKFDGGFRVFKVDDSNMKDVYYAPADYNQSLLDKLESNIKEDRTDLDLFFGCILDWGLPLNLSYTSETIDNCSVHTYSDNDLIACFNDNIPESVIKEIAKRKPLRVVFRDSSFADTPSKINVTEIFKLLSPDTRVKVI
jgi:adenine-specific DNA-methyltransferase